MRLLVLAQTPPPVHGQSLMVQTLVEGLHLQAPDIEVILVDLALSENTADVGRWRIGKLFALWRICLHARKILRSDPAIALYYIPAPGKYGALIRDWLVMAVCRRRGQRLVLHWHASGLGEWLARRPVARFLTKRLLGKPDLSLTMTPSLARDAAFLEPVFTRTVANGISVASVAHEPTPSRRHRLLYLGLCSREKGLFDLINALKLLEKKKPGTYELTVAGSFQNSAEQKHFIRETADLGLSLKTVGFAGPSAKDKLLAETDVVCLPTYYPHEAQPLVALEAMARDKKVVATQWRGLPETLPSSQSWTCPVQNPVELAAAIERAVAAPPPAGESRRWFEARFTVEKHLETLATALRSLDTRA